MRPRRARRLARWIGWLAVAVASTAWAAPAAAPAAENVARLDAYLAGLVPFGFSGAVLVARDDQILLEQGYGRADDAAGRDVTAATVFDVCSFTKQFTAAAILALEEQGKLRTEDPLFRHLAGVPSDKSAITLHHLLTHSAGIDDPPAEDYERAERDDYVRQVLASPLLWKPGSRYAYSNGGYSLLGALVEILSGQSYEQFLDARFFKPLGLSKTGYRRSRWTAGEVAHGYADGREFGSPLDHPGPYHEAEPGRWPGPYWALVTNGGVLSTVGDLYRWSRALDGERTWAPRRGRRSSAPPCSPKSGATKPATRMGGTSRARRAARRSSTTPAAREPASTPGCCATSTSMRP